MVDLREEILKKQAEECEKYKEMRRLEEYKIQAHLQIEKQKMMMEMMKAQQEAKKIKTPTLGSI